MTTLMLLNGGFGARVGANMPKQLLRLKGVPIFIYSLRMADQIDQISLVILNYPEGWKSKIENLVTQYAIKTPVRYVEAGKTRQSSVKLMVDVVETPTVLIHEAARPLATIAEFNMLIENADPNITLTRPIPFTVLESSNAAPEVSAILERSRLLNIQLPQKFNTKALSEAHNKAKKENLEFTEDASVVFHYGDTVNHLLGRDRNFKITTKLDIQMAEFLLLENQDGVFHDK